MAQGKREESLVEAIVADMFAELEHVGGFDGDMLQRLKRLAARGRLGKAAEVTRAIKDASGEHNEAS